jgi:hypothetical protein
MAAIVAKLLMLVLLNVKILDKAIKRSYTSTTAFATIVFTLQTATLVVSDSYGSALQMESPMVAGVLEQAQSILNPDKQTPEKCLFPTSLASKLFVEAILPPVLALLVLTAIALPWHSSGISCGLERSCNKKRSWSDALAGKRKRKNLAKEWQGEGLPDGTYAVMTRRNPDDNAAAAGNFPDGNTRPSVELQDGNRGQVWIAHNTIAALEPSDYEQLSVRELRRLLAMANVTTNGTEDQGSLLRTLRFQSDCNEVLVDTSLMPHKIHAYQIKQACFLVPPRAPQVPASLSRVWIFLTIENQYE